jgi:hypothetical protein
VPLKFGTLCATVDHVIAMLRERRQAIAALLRQFDGRDEWTLRICHDAAALSIELQTREPALLALAADERRLPEGRAYFVRKKLQRATADLISAHVAAVEHDVLARLTSLDLEIGAAEGNSGQVTVLVPRARFRELEAALADLEAAHAQSHVTFELVGPWPPYSFTNALELSA